MGWSNWVAGAGYRGRSQEGQEAFTGACPLERPDLCEPLTQLVVGLDQLGQQRIVLRQSVH